MRVRSQKEKHQTIGAHVPVRLKRSIEDAALRLGRTTSSVVSEALVVWLRTHAPQKALSARRRRFKAE